MFSLVKHTTIDNGLTTPLFHLCIPPLAQPFKTSVRTTFRAHRGCCSNLPMPPKRSNNGNPGGVEENSTLSNQCRRPTHTKETGPIGILTEGHPTDNESKSENTSTNRQEPCLDETMHTSKRSRNYIDKSSSYSTKWQQSKVDNLKNTIQEVEELHNKLPKEVYDLKKAKYSALRNEDFGGFCPTKLGLFCHKKSLKHVFSMGTPWIYTCQ
jgi:hypothetical protein